MRKITKLAAAAFHARKPFHLDNTEVRTYDTSAEMLLHGNHIAVITEKGIQVNLAGWNTPTTRERLNGIDGVNIHTKAGQAFLNDEPIPSSGWVHVPQIATATA